MKFTSAAAVEQVVWEMRLADYPRALNRAAMNTLYNGAPPFTEQEAQQNRINTNVNFLEGTKILHDARRQFATAFMSADPLFTVNVDQGPVWKKREWSATITREINKRLKGSLSYLEARRSVFASIVLHGIGPVNWEDAERWCPKDKGIEDVLIPSNTLTSLDNLPFFAVYRQYTAPELARCIQGPRVDKGWNVPLVKRAIKWVDEQAAQLFSSSWPEVWSPEKMEERVKQDGGLYASDSVPTIDTFDFYFWSDEGKQAGWRRRIILDAWGEPGQGAGGIATSGNQRQSDKYGLGNRSEFLYDSGNKVFADDIKKITHFQFADASCVAPFRYHSVRSLGFLLYAVCHLQNRLRCKFNDHVFESLLQYFRVANPEDAERLSKVDLVNYGVLPDGLNMVGPNERWQVQDGVVERAFDMNRQTMADNSASFVQDFDFGKEKEETATRTMAKVNATAALVGAMLNQAYNYQQFQYQEIARRFCIPNSRDKDVREFRNECLKAEVPEEALRVEAWDVQPVRVIGNGNKMLQVAMADKLFAMRGMLDPRAQKEVDRIYVLANSDDPDLAERLVPEVREISASVHDAQLAAGVLMQGLMVTPQPGVNYVEYVETLLHALASVVKRIEATGGMATREELTGLMNLGAHIAQNIQLLAQDKNEKPRVKQYQDDLKALMNHVKAYAQRLQQQQQQEQGGGPDGKDAAKIQGMVLQSQTKAKLAQQSHAQRTAQRQIQFEQDLNHRAAEHKMELAKMDLETAGTIRRHGMTSFDE